MSLALKKLNTYRVIDPMMNIESEKYYAILTGANQVSWKPILSTSFSNTSSTFSAPPPSPGMVVRRRVWLKQPVTIDFVGTAPVGQNLLQTGFDAFRAYPLSTNMNTLNININNTSTNINMSDVIQGLLRYHNECPLQERELSTTPAMMDQSQRYANLANSVRNPLAGYIDSNNGACTGRGAFPYKTIVNNTADASGNATAQISADITEELFLSPLIFGGGGTDASGFVGVQTFQVIVNWNNDLRRMWSHDNSSGSILTSILVTLGQPTLLFQYKSPDPQKTPLPMRREYPYYEIQRYPTDSLSAVAGFPSAQATLSLSSQNIQLNSIPRMMYIFARKKNGDLSFLDSDAFFSINSIKINWNNQSGLLSNASQQDLYQMSRKNGVSMSWQQWSGGSSYNFSGSSNDRVAGQGSVLAVEFGTDIACQGWDAPGMSGTYQLQFEVNVSNVSTETITPTLYVVVISEGIFVIENNSAYSQIGVISPTDVANSKMLKGLDYEDLKYMAGAGNFFGDVRDFFSKAVRKVRKGLKEADPYLRPLAGLAKMVIPGSRELLPLVGYVQNVGGQSVGGAYVGGRKCYKKTRVPCKSKAKKKAKKKKSKKYKKKKGRGGILMGGAMISRAELRNRLEDMDC